LAGTGIRRNPEESGVNTGAKNRNSCDHLQNHVPVKIPPEITEKKEILRNPGRNGFFGPKNKFLKTGICNLDEALRSALTL
jgi:hypothetical protein